MQKIKFPPPRERHDPNIKQQKPIPKTHDLINSESTYATALSKNTKSNKRNLPEEDISLHTNSNQNTLQSICVNLGNLSHGVVKQLTTISTLVAKLTTKLLQHSSH